MESSSYGAYAEASFESPGSAVLAGDSYREAARWRGRDREKLSPAVAPDAGPSRSRPDWNVVLGCLDHALALEGRRRDIYVNRLATDQPDIAASVAQLLARHAQPHALLDAGAIESAAQALASDMDANLAAGTVMGPYRIVRGLGQGGMGSVYLAESVRDSNARPQTTPSRVALKVVSHAFLSQSLMERFEREIVVLGKLDHAQIPKLFDHGVAGQLCWLAMSHVDGLPITDYCDRHSLNILARLSLLVSLAEVLAYAHAHNIVHRDIKASNILVDCDGKVHLLDFGVAKTQQADPALRGLTLDALAPMTFECAAPEQFRVGAPITAQTDVYQFGVLAYRLLTGKSPYSAEPGDLLGWGNVITSQAPPRLKKLPADAHCTGRSASLRRAVVLRLDEIMTRALAKNPADRYRTMNSLRQDLALLLSNAQRTMPRVPWHRRLAKMLTH